MKKLSLVMAAAMCMTVGGVYAAWSYADEKKIVDDVTEEKMRIQMGGLDTTATSASIKLNNNNMAMTVEGQIVENTINCAVLTPTENTGLSIRVAINKTSTITDLKLTYTLTITNAQYLGVDIFTCNNPSVPDPEMPNKITSTFEETVSIDDMTLVQVDNENVVYMNLEYSTADIMDKFKLKLTQSFNLPTKDEFNAFQAHLITTSLYVNVAVEDVS